MNIDAPQRIAKISREAGIEKLIHFSCLNASPNPQKIYLKGGSKFLKTKVIFVKKIFFYSNMNIIKNLKKKYEGELAVRSEFPEAVIIRPSVMFGEDDRFLYYYLNGKRRTPFTIPLWRRGEKTIKIPVHVSFFCIT